MPDWYADSGTSTTLTLRERAERMAAVGGFLGVPLEDFEDGGKGQIEALTVLGLTERSTVLDFGCGVLRGGYWLIHFLAAGCYCGIEPRRDRVELGLTYLLEPGVGDAKRPRFDHNAAFDSSVFGQTFDFFLACSIWTHASKPQIELMLDSFWRDSRLGSVFLTSYLPARLVRNRDYRGTAWVGTSHESDTPGIVYHRFSWIRRACRRRQLSVRHFPHPNCDSQVWLEIRHERGA